MGQAEAAPPRHLVVVGHPDRHSFNHALAEAYCRGVRESGQEAEVNDLYARGFDPLLRADERPGPDYHLSVDVTAELEMLDRADALVLVYPIWFGLPPAIIKGYVDKVMGADFSARRIKAHIPNARLSGMHLLSISTSASTMPWLEEQGQWIALREAFDRYVTNIFGLRDSDHLHFDAIVSNLKPAFAQEMLDVVAARARRMASTLLKEQHARHTEEVMARRNKPSVTN
ncbi:NAD(P)H-dependent oxidoreductase [Stakelama marina]|uniref:NAD(P)H-dependent oxidoreductase n=1 Tax=Stakelama marina TaxID=2826939 RepID=A0A8T4I9T7_9SPHN|nr:NAD(P)H-dependent oxidoreductase [Stakelama marina]MBR0551270.1 NAD(P)H-dependent oxidoreductase [Stakelama marina]